MAMNLKIYNMSNKASGEVEVNSDVFDAAFNKALVHQVITAYQANGRADTKGWKNRAAVSGGGAKPWKQKGTGRARAGTSRGPLWRSGGVTFGSGHALHDQKINKKMYNGAMRSIISEHLRNGTIKIFDQFTVKEVKTKDIVKFMEKLEANRALFVDKALDDKFAMSCRNIPGASLCDSVWIDPVVLFKAKHVFITVDGLKALEERYAS